MWEVVIEFLINILDVMFFWTDRDSPWRSIIAILCIIGFITSLYYMFHSFGKSTVL